MKNEQEQQLSTLNESALRDISVLSPSQRREQERLRKEKEAKDAADKEKRRIAAAKRKAAEKAAEAKARREDILRRVPIAIIRSLLFFVFICFVSVVILFFVSFFIDSENPNLDIMWYSLYIGGFAAVWRFVKDMQE